MRELSPWLGFCHIRNETDDARSSQQTLVAAWADSVEAFEREVHFHTNTHGLQMILAEEVLPATEWMQKHPDRKDAQRLAAKVRGKHPVEIGSLGRGMTGRGVDGESDDDTEGYLHIEEIKGVEPLDNQFGVHPPKTVPDALYQPLFGQPDPTRPRPRWRNALARTRFRRCTPTPFWTRPFTRPDANPPLLIYKATSKGVKVLSLRS